MSTVPTKVCDRCKRGGAKMLLPTSTDKWGLRLNDPPSLNLFGDSRDRFWHEVEAIEMVKARLTCRLCAAVWKSLTRLNGNVPPPTELDGQQLRVRTVSMPYAYWFPGYKYAGECAIQRLSVFLYRPLGLEDPYEEDPLRDAVLVNFFAFQACETDPFHVSNVCDTRGAEMTAQRVSFGGRMRPLQADLRLISWWVGVCSQDHQSTCRQIPTATSSKELRTLRVIDIERACIAELPFTSNLVYITLSYVWGNSSCVDLLSSNKEELFRASGLEPYRLPNTYEDLVELSSHLGCRYVWIDRLCILQDVPQDLTHYLSMMDEIYSSAFLTVIAASGDNVHAGLPGIRPGTRHRTQDVLPVWATVTDAYLNPGEHFKKQRNLVLMNTLRPQKLRDDDILSGTTWDKRAWCMQERVLSRRSLIFMDEQIYWECHGGSFCEESEFDFWQDRTFRYAEQASLVGLRAPNAKPEEAVIAGPSTYWVDTEAGRRLKPLPRHDGIWEQYYSLVLQYSRRQLTFQKDCFNAFRGILQHMTKVTGEEFFWAMPQSFFELSLIWKGSTDRRLALQPSPDGTEEYLFPSWSWISWYEHVWYPIPVGKDQAVVLQINPIRFRTVTADELSTHDTVPHRSEIICWRMRDDGSLTPIRPDSVPAGCVFGQESNLNAKGELRPWKPEKTPRPDFELSRSIATDMGAAIWFHTSMAKFTIRLDPDSVDEGQSGFDEHGKAVCKFNIPLIIDGEDRIVGRMSSQLERSWNLAHDGTQQECDLIVISSFEEGDPHVKMLDVMEIKWLHDFAYRVNIGRISEEAWMRADREWRLIALS